MSLAHGAHTDTTCHACLAHLPSEAEAAAAGSGSGSGSGSVRCQLCDCAVYCDAACRAKDAPLHALECALRRAGGGGEAGEGVRNNRDAAATAAATAAAAAAGGVGCALVADEVWTTRLLARAVAWSEEGETRRTGEEGRGDVLWGLESKPNATLDAAAGAVVHAPHHHTKV